jgi:hypothetical protein
MPAFSCARLTRALANTKPETDQLLQTTPYIYRSLYMKRRRLGVAPTTATSTGRVGLRRMGFGRIGRASRYLGIARPA